MAGGGITRRRNRPRSRRRVGLSCHRRKPPLRDRRFTPRCCTRWASTPGVSKSLAQARLASISDSRFAISSRRPVAGRVDRGCSALRAEQSAEAFAAKLGVNWLFSRPDARPRTYPGARYRRNLDHPHGAVQARIVMFDQRAELTRSSSGKSRRHRPTPGPQSPQSSPSHAADWPVSLWIAFSNGMSCGFSSTCCSICKAPS